MPRQASHNALIGKGLVTVLTHEWARRELNPLAHASHLRRYALRVCARAVACRCPQFRSETVVPHGITDDLGEVVVDADPRPRPRAHSARGEAFS